MGVGVTVLISFSYFLAYFRLRHQKRKILYHKFVHSAEASQFDYVCTLYLINLNLFFVRRQHLLFTLEWILMPLIQCIEQSVLVLIYYFVERKNKTMKNEFGIGSTGCYWLLLLNFKHLGSRRPENINKCSIVTHQCHLIAFIFHKNFKL